MLEKLFTSKARVKLLGILLFNQDREYHLRELARLTSVSPIYLSKELGNLERLNIATKTKKANLSIYRLNGGCIILEELRQLFLKTDYLGDLIKKQFKDAKYCFIYGSFAAGTEAKSSDIDLFIVAGIKEDEVISKIQRLEKTVNREINYVLWTEDTFIQRARNGHHLLRNINKGKIIMLVGDEDEFRKQVG